jgi:hypothetical protein
MLHRIRDALPLVIERINGYVDVGIFDLPTRRSGRSSVRSHASVLCIAEATPSASDDAVPGDVFLQTLPANLPDRWLYHTLYGEVEQEAHVRADPPTLATARELRFESVEEATNRCAPPLVIDRVRTMLEQSLREAHHGPVSERYLPGYLAEFAFHWNYGLGGRFWRTFLAVYALSCDRHLHGAV